MHGIGKRTLIPLVAALLMQTATVFGATYRLGGRGPEIIELQQSLSGMGYGALKADGIFGKGTEEALKRFQADHNLSADGVYGPATQRELKQAAAQPAPVEYTVTEGDSLWTISRKHKTTVAAIAGANDIPEESTLKIGQRLIIPVERVSPSTRGMSVMEESGAKILPWTTADPLLAVGGTYTVTDVKTGVSLQAKRIGGELHADSEPLTASDTETLKGMYGGSWSWDRRAVIVQYGDMRLAASINGMPHGSDTIPDNGFNGMFCIHFLGSRVHKSLEIDPQHQAMIRYAAGL